MKKDSAKSPKNEKFVYELPDNLKQSSEAKILFLLLILLPVGFLISLIIGASPEQFSYFLLAVPAFWIFYRLTISKNTTPLLGKKYYGEIERWIETSVRCPECNGKVKFMRWSYLPPGFIIAEVQCTNCNKSSRFVKRYSDVSLEGYTGDYKTPNPLLVILLIILIAAMLAWYIHSRGFV